MSRVNNFCFKLLICTFKAEHTFTNSLKRSLNTIMHTVWQIRKKVIYDQINKCVRSYFENY